MSEFIGMAHAVFCTTTDRQTDKIDQRLRSSQNLGQGQRYYSWMGFRIYSKPDRTQNTKVNMDHVSIVSTAAHDLIVWTVSLMTGLGMRH